jgi:hypothetical protein
MATFAFVEINRKHDNELSISEITTTFQLCRIYLLIIILDSVVLYALWYRL